jgi:glutamyl-Q tRNA(Asp) synthetase
MFCRMADDRPVFRFAPSPNGELHLGHALSALIGFRAAKAAGGRFLVRIEDIDAGRSRAEFVNGILDDLAWLGLTWERPVTFQSGRLGAYRDAASRLQALGVLYPCWATRSEIEAAAAGAPPARDPDGAPIYPGLWKGRSQADVAAMRSGGAPCALRLDLDAACALARDRLGGAPLTFAETACGSASAAPVTARPERWGDAVIVRKDAPASYHLAVVVDDAWQGVTHVTRGRDLYAATGLHRLLQLLLDLPAPVYHHHRLIVDASGRKLAKSAGDTSLRALREAGATPADIRRLVGLD